MMKFLEDLYSSGISSFEVINTLHDEHLSHWNDLIEYLIKSKDDKLLVKTAILLGKQISCDIHNEVESGEEEKIKRVCEKQVKILTCACRKEFLELLTVRILAWSEKVDIGNESDELGSVLVSIHSFGEAVLDKLPFLGKDLLPNLICTSVGVLAASQQLSGEHPTLLQGLTGLQQKIKESKNSGITETFEHYLHSDETPEDFRKVQIIPTLQELLEDKRPFLHPNKIKEAYFSPDHYLDVQFRLLREDFVQPLRKGVEHFLENKDEYLKTKGIKKFKCQQHDASVRLYTRLTFNRVVKSRGAGNVYFFNLPQEMVLEVNWNTSKKLLPGSLVMLTSDSCKTAIFARLLPPFYQYTNNGVDARRRELSEGILRVSIEAGEEHVEKKSSFIMFECDVHFEAYKCKLSILQKTRMLEEGSLMSKFIVEAKNSIDIPGKWNKPGSLMLPFNRQYPQASPPPVLVSPDKGEWPKKLIQTQMGLDDSQYEAFKTALTSELSIIQGPPGTGKTFIALQIVKTLLLNMGKTFALGLFNSSLKHDWMVPKSPILILCHTNHALDQFLELILKEISGVNLIRVGGQCKFGVLRDHTFQEKRKKHDWGWYLATKTLYRNIVTLENSISGLRDNIKVLENPRGILDFSTMSSLWDKVGPKFPDFLRRALESGEWLGISEYNVSKPLDTELTKLVQSGMTRRRQGEHDDDDKMMMSMKREDERKPTNYAEVHVMDKLLEHRLSDNYYENRFKTENLEATDELFFPYKYLNNCSPFGCWDEAKELEAKIKAISGPELVLQRNELGLEREEYINRAKFLITLFNLHKQGHLQLPNVDNFLRPEKVMRNVREYRPVIRSCHRYHHHYECDSDCYSENDDDYDDYIYVERLVDGFVYSQPEYSIKSFSMKEKWALYFKVLDIALDFERRQLPQMEKDLKPLRQSLKEMRQQRDVVLLQETDVIGMTTTAAVKNRWMLEIAKPQIVVIKEATEILEADIVTSITEDCNQLILIGEQVQNLPIANENQPQKKNHMNFSLERLIINNVNVCSLKTQHRMHPEIADLIVGSFFSEFENHPNVLAYPRVKGLTKNLFFLTHSQLENGELDTELLSKTNYYEADFINGLCKYLLNQGYESSQITILATYTRQMFLISKVISTGGVRIACVDDYRGEENDIILLSLVSSKKEDEIDLVGIDNQICLALSRAKYGMYIVGNLEKLMNASKTWKQIGTKLEASGNCGESLELICTQHGNKTRVSEPAHFAPLKLGGCGLKCDRVLDCTHRCQLQCHGMDFSQFYCIQLLEKICPCRFEQQCDRGRCVHECGPCRTLVMKTLRCGHQGQLSCHANEDFFKCDIIVQKKLEPCGHIRSVKCHLSVYKVDCDVEVDHTFDVCKHTGRIMCFQKDQVNCKDNCEKMLKCGHLCTRRCHVHDDPTHKNFFCNDTECKRVCILGHPCQIEHNCWRRCPPCPILTKATLDCGHEAELPCHQRPSPNARRRRSCKFLAYRHKMLVRSGMESEDYKCMAKCEKLCGSGHPCGVDHACHEECPPCQTKIENAWSCHADDNVTLACHVDGTSHVCGERTASELKRVHKAKDECHDLDDILGF